MILTAVAAAAKNRVIGANNKLPWHLPADLKHFKKLTMGHHILMGRKTWEALPNGPLPGRTNVVISRSTLNVPHGVRVFPAIDQAIEWIYRQQETEAFIIGGAQIYQSTLNMLDRIYLTEVDAEPKGDAYFPDYHASEWEVAAREVHPADDKHAYTCTFLTLERIKKRKEYAKPWRGFDY
jgi:dihydrofolate reductase